MQNQNDGMRVDREAAPGPASNVAQGPAPVSDAARGLRVVFDLLLQDMALEPVALASLPWHEPILLLRSAPMPRFRAALQQIVACCPAPRLHVLSHAHDEEAIREGAPCDFTFHAYPTPGRYRLEAVPPAMLDRLRSTGFGILLFVDPGTSGDLFGEVERLFAAIRGDRMVSFRQDGTCARTPDARLRRRAESAFLRLIEWYQLKLDPDFADGPLTAPADVSVGV